MIEKYKKLDMFNKSMVFTIIYSLIALIIGLVLLIVDTSWIYGIAIGVALVLLTSLINYCIYKLPCKGAMNAVGLPTIALVSRVIVFATMFLVIVFIINPSLHPEIEGTFDQVFLFQDINTIIMLFTYMIPIYSLVTVTVINIFEEK